ncbi:type III secretion specific chlamydia chaperone 2 [Waddlia chondrophila 2032/99]|uniref:Type III secretion specific chlamydia chaperone 2 n=1 Tax=Waddlia chondrophila 2032/99 TaxID=765953 RepID=F8LF03_9BACT|nr:type III secretion specific chlamydia chaperone 2 [Waddlia chondrophila 2032/99]
MQLPLRIKPARKKREGEMAKTKKKDQGKLTEEMVENFIDEKLEQFKGKLNQEELEMQRQALKEVFIKGRPPRHAMGISPDFMNVLYAFAYNAYNAGKYEDAHNTFKMLNFLEPLTPKYLHGLAASLHKMKKYNEAVEMYFTLAMVEEESPVPYFHIADCYEKLGNPGGILIGLGGAISRCGEESKYAKIKQRCYAMMSKTKQEMGIKDETPILESEEEQDSGIFERLKEEAGSGLDT